MATSSNSEVEPILGIQFSIFSPDEIERRSVVEITSNATYEGNEPKIGGLFDPRMGVLENGKQCRSCGQSNNNCPGHFGHYRLARPVYYIQFLPMILNVLSCVCINCSRLRVDKELRSGIKAKSGEGRWKELLEVSSNISRCGQETEDGCGTRQPNRYKREGIARIVAEWDTIETKTVKADSMRQPLEVEYVQRLFRRITDEDVAFMGFNPRWCRPDWMICSFLAIPPPHVRPSVVQENNQRSEDDLTHKLFEIIKTNNMLQTRIDADANKTNKTYVDELTNVLQYHIATLIDNHIPGVAPSAQRGGRPLKSIQQRLGSKEGRIRYNLQGKRVEMSARSVITPDPNISVAELGVPTRIAMNLTQPERVTEYNIDKLYKLVQNGSAVYPGAKTLVRKDGRMISLAHVNTKEIVLYHGDTVNRHLLDGDMVLFNRQPTLHRMSMMGHRVRVLPYNTFRLNVSVTSPYNADFDGDEMNAHIPQSSEAIQELQDIAAVPYQMISPRHQKPVIKVVQDSLLGTYRITKQGDTFTKREYMNLMMWNKRFDGTLPDSEIIAGAPRWSGQKVVSSLFQSMNMDLKNKFYDDDSSENNMVKIREGAIQASGIVDDDVLNKTGVGVVHTTFNDFGPHAAVELIDSLQSTIEAYLVMSGFSVGLSDLVADEATLTTMNEIVQKRKKEIDEIVLQVHMDLFDNSTGKTNQDEFESQVFGKLNKAIEELGKLGQQALAPQNRMISMLKAGSKGSTINVSQMVACVGQQNIEGRRIPYGFTDRTLPHYKKYDDGAEARGFVENSFVKGLTPQEFFFHAMSGREGLIDTAVKSVTGDTPIIVIEQGVPKYLRIGDWIDAHLDSMPDQVEHHVERELELLHLKDTTYIPTADLDGNVTWGQITAVTRHNPGDQLYEILTSAGKRVIVTESKALIIWNPKLNAFERMATPDVKPGHCVPVTATLSTPPVMIDSINIRKYLPPSEYIYGTDFTIAIAQLLVAMENTSKIPSGWWETNNGTTFTLPYPSKARLQRTLVRSNIDEIREGYVYPYSGKRIDTRIPDTFVLSEPNGIFLGLFLAEGNADISSGYVQITNNDSVIRSFAINWFTQHHIQYTEEIKTNAAGGTSSCVRGYSCILAKLLTALVGHGAENKHIPDEAYIAPEAFVKGLLNGYFSGDGTVSKNSVEAGSASSRLIDGISMLCTRLGIFGKIFVTQSKSNNFGTPTILSSHRIAIRAQFATRFSEKITLLDASKQEKLRLMNASLEHRNYPKHNDVVLDKIIKINLIDVKKYPKVYDLTVPSTLNFGLANGLHVVDTAETGYIQRQMVKAMEDLVTQHDGTVRDARMNICQFKYGEDGLSSTKVETQGLPLHTMKEEDLRALITMNGITWADVLTVPRVENAEMVNAFLEQVLEDRAMLVNGVFRNGRAKGLMGPMNLDRMIVSLKVKFNLSANAKTDLTPEYVYERLADLQKRTQPYHRMWAAMLRFHLGPHNTVLKHRMTQIAFNALIEQILVKNWAAWAQPGEQVGIIAAQSIGEPATQMSAIASSFVIIEKNGSVYSGPIGAFIDGLLKNSKVKTLGPDSVVLDLEEPMKIIGVSNNEKTSWREISQISRHPANGGLVEVHTRSGRKTTATLTHSFLKRSKEGIVPVLGSDLTVGMRIPVARYIPTIEKPLTIAKQGSTVFTLNKEFGWVCGIYLADGSCNGNTVSICKIAPIVESRLSAFAKEHNMQFSTFLYMGQYGPGKNNVLKSKDLKDFLKATFGEGSFTKGVGSLAYAAPLTFIQGLIGGFFDGDGNISVSKQLIRASSRSKTLLEGINRLLGYCSMFGVLGEETSVRIPDAVQYILTIPRKFARLYQDTIGFELPQKAKSLINLVQYTEREDAHNTQEMIDKIPEVGTAIATVGRLLGLPGQSRTYGRWAKKESIGRRTLEAYMNTFRTAVQGLGTVSSELASCMAALESALDADVLWDEIVNLVYLDDPKTFVYDFTVPGNDSFMVDDNILVHNTLNSVDWDTRIIIAKNGALWTPEIGDFVDSYYLDCKDKSRIQYLPNSQIYIDLNDGNDWKAMSSDKEGKIVWTKLEAITRHPVVNADGTDTILEVTLESGRSVKGTKAKSFLTRIDGKVEGINGSELKVGDVIPISNTLSIEHLGTINTLELRSLLKPTEWLYGSEVEKALAEMEDGRTWFYKNNGKKFTVPYARSDTFRDAFVKQRNSNTIRAGYVYPKRTRPDISQIPESILLDRAVGYFVGAYLAEGMSNATQIHISNNDRTYLKPIQDLLNTWNVGYHVVCEHRTAIKTGIKGLTTSLVIHSTLLSKVFSELFGRLSYTKTLPDWVFQAPDAFVHGLIDAYICGDGTIKKRDGVICATTVSEALSVRLSTLLARYGIFSTSYSSTPKKGLFNSVAKNYTLYIPQKYAAVFAKTFTLSLAAKQSVLDKHYANTKVRHCKREVQNDIVWDKVKSIKEVRPIKGYVYDVTVELTRNFTALNAIGLADTFHLAGVAAKSGMTRGVPRLKELFKVTKSPKATSLSIFLKPEFRENKEKAREVAQDLELTMLRDIVTSLALYYDPSDDTTVIEEDKDLLKFYKFFETRNKGEEPAFSRWMLRMEFNRDIMFNRNITMDDVAYVLNDKFNDSINMVYTDFNTEKLIMRIRISPDLDKTLDSKDDYINFKKFQSRLLTTVAVRGVIGIKATSFSKYENRVELVDGNPTKITEYTIDTDGSNFIEVMNHPAVDPTRLYTTHVHDILDIFGIEASRAILFSEIDSLFTDAGVNYRHLGLLVDTMTRNGRLMSVDRYGINKNAIGPLAKASFEETEKILLRAALFGEMDPVTGVSSKIMTGQPIRGGTTFTHLLLDEAALLRLQKGLPSKKEAEEEDVDDLDEEDIARELAGAADDKCNVVRLRMNTILPESDVTLEEPDVELNIMDG